MFLDSEECEAPAYPSLAGGAYILMIIPSVYFGLDSIFIYFNLIVRESNTTSIVVSHLGIRVCPRELSYRYCCFLQKTDFRIDQRIGLVNQDLHAFGSIVI